VEQLLDAAHDKGIHAAIETNLCFDFERIEDVLRKCDLVMFDIKLMDDEAHKTYTGVSNQKVLANAKRLDELGLLKEVHPLLELNDEKRDMADRMRRVLEWYMRLYLPEEPDLLMLMVIALCRRCRGPEIEEVLDRLQFSDKRRRSTMLVRSAIMGVRQGMQRWEKNDGPVSELHRLLCRVPLEALLYLLAKEDKPEQHEKLTRYIYQGRQMKIDISGADLNRMGVEPGPMIGRILDEVLAAKLDDEDMSREAQLTLAGRLALQFAAEEERLRAEKLQEKLEAKLEEKRSADDKA
jgi:tRNA nucleotidyltransferase (CCA-adding enzyme)